MPIHVDVIRGFLTRWETRQPVAYIPCRKRNFTGREDPARCGEPVGASGVTVGAGLDLGQQSEADLRRMGLPALLIERFRPYLGKRREDAVDALSRFPLTLIDVECDTMDAAVHGDYIRRAADIYDRDTAGRPFAALPPQAQAVIVSLFYQLGAPSKYPKTWKYLCACDWASASYELRTGFKRYANRRADEGRLLEEIA